MEKKKEIYVNTGFETRNRRLPVPKTKEKAVCLCCKRPLRINVTGRDWDQDKRVYVDTENTKWYYVGHTYFCTQRCGIIYGTMAADKKLKINIKD
jgi:hypothetical protein